jgi:hypothetical protein
MESPAPLLEAAETEALAVMNYPRLALAAAGGTVAYFAVGFLAFGLLPVLRNEYAKYPAVYRSQERCAPL